MYKFKLILLLFLLPSISVAPHANSKEFDPQKSRKELEKGYSIGQKDFFDKKFSNKFTSKGLIRFPDMRELKRRPQFVEQKYEIKDQFLAFSDKLVYRPGEKIRVYIKAEGQVTIELYNVSPGRTKLIKSTKRNFINSHVNIFNTFYGFEEMKDFTKLAFDVHHHVGWFNFIISNQDVTTHVPVFVEDIKERSVLFIESTDTLKAYNSKETFRNMYHNPRKLSFGEFSRPMAYPMNYKIIDFSSIDKLNEPINCNEHLINADFLHKQSLNELNIPFDIASDAFLDEEHDLTRYQMIVLGTHNEYWSKKKIHKITEYVENGGSLLILGGNTAWGWIMRSGDFDVIHGSNILRLEDSLEPFLSKILGSYYSAEGFDTYAPYRTTSEINSFGIEFLTESEFAVSSDFYTCRDKILGGSGHETDKLYEKSENFRIIAVGTNTEGGANVVYKKFESGGQVLNFGSLSLWHRSTDPIVRGLISLIYENSQKK